jgi:hypothetical protein
MKTLSSNTTYTPKQLRCLHAAARSAYAAAGGPTLGAFDPWRRVQIHHVTGNHGFTDCRQSDFSSLLGHFQHLAGDDAAAFSSHMRAGKTQEVDTTQTRWHLDQAIAKIGSFLTNDPDHMVDAGQAYCLAIARDQLGRNFTWDSLGRMPAETLTRLVFTIRNRAAQMARKFAADAVPESTPEIDPSDPF